MADETDDKVRRQFSLILTLISNRFGLLKEEIFQSVPEYHQQYDAFDDSKLDSLERKFERDKDDIRELGVVIEAFSVEHSWGGGQETRYRIVGENYDFPDDVTFTQAEMTLLRLAAEAWRDGSLSLDSRHALTKLRSLGVPANEPLIGLAPRINTQNPIFEALKSILDISGVATFLYLKPGETQARQRKSAPLALVLRRGLWYMLAHDTEADAQRTFLLSRMVSIPKRHGSAVFDAGSQNYTAQLEAELDELERAHAARIWVEPGSDAFVRLSSTYANPGEDNVIDVHYSDIDLLADELTEFGADVKVIAPTELSVALASRFAALARTHGGVK